MLNTVLQFCKESHPPNYCYITRSLMRRNFQVEKTEKTTKGGT